MRILTFCQLFLLSFLISCVGTVQEAAVPENRISSGNPTVFSYPGIINARGISHNRIEVEFAPLNGPQFEYSLYVNDSLTPVKLDPNSLFPTLGGRLLYTITNLNTDSEYKLKITANNIDTGARSTNESTVFVRTFDNTVADFSGISRVTLTPGNQTNSMDIKWIAPKMSSLVSAGDYDPVCYQITYISDTGGPGNLNTRGYTGSDRTTVYVPECYKNPPALATPFDNPSEHTISTLNPNTTYFVQVRAIHKLFHSNNGNPSTNTFSVDSNTRYIRIRTNSLSGDFDFPLDKLKLSNAKGLDAFNKISAAWQPASGIFDSYRIFYRKYTGTGDPENDDQLTDAVIASMNAGSNFTAVPANQTSAIISGLETGEFYQVKVALCKTVACPVAPSDPNAAIFTDLRSIQVVGKLASFTGINVIENPGQFSENDMVHLKFDSPVITDGYATDLEFYCVDPDPNNQSNMVLLPKNTPLTGSSISSCNGLYIETSGLIDLSKYKQQKIKGIIANSTTKYCFAATPVVIGYGPVLRLPVGERIVRCSYPEVKPPSLEQFPGLTNSCSISGRTSSLAWNLPNGGIYSGFQVYWKEKSAGQIFSFADATNAASGYSTSGKLNADVVSFDVPNLIPGKSYQFGVLAVTDLPAPTGTLYSEYNLNVLECNLPLPLANFKGFSRIFSIGPKYDGRIPNDILTKAPPLDARIFEAINSDGIPYEVPMSSPGTPEVVGYYQDPPGRDFANFSANFDGRKGNNGFALSRNGIVSLAWEEVDFPHPDITSLFVSEQPAANVDRSSRRWGYRVYRSHDNKLTWQNITDQAGVLFSMPYDYRKRANATPTSTRMAFFTDYSVNALAEVHDASNGRDIDRARIYYYRITPVFDGKELNYFANSNNHIVKVTLPPPNMALVHRWMANRSHCFEMNKDIDLSDNYSCSYNGIGSTGRNFPYRTSNTKYDQGGDLLVDRFELGCKFTRGDKVDDPRIGASHFDSILTSRPSKGDSEIYPQFRGYKSNGTILDPSTPFKGCIGKNSLADSNPLPLGYSANYNQYIHGDCTGSSGVNLYHRACTSDERDKGLTSAYYVIPGLGANTDMRDCSVHNSTSPPHRAGLIDIDDMFRNHVLHSEFLGVFHNRFVQSGGYTRGPAFYGPVATDITAEEDLRAASSYSGTNSCSINLASIDSDGYMRPRWVEASDLASRITFKGTKQNLLDKTIAEITEVETNPTAPPTLYNGTQGDPTNAAFKLPATNLRTSSRYRNTTQLGKVITSNASKLPPIASISQFSGDALCGTSWVQVGVANDNDQFAATSSAKKKRLIRRTESVTAAAWSESFDDAKIVQIESNTPALDGSCVSNNRSYTGQDVSRGSFIRNFNTQYSGPNTVITDMPFLTGSSPYNLFTTAPIQSQHSQLCTSKYGVQDLVGNMLEVNSERIFCDYSEDGIFLGPVSTWPGTKEARDIELPGTHVPFFNSDAERESWYVLYEATGVLPTGAPTTFELKLHDGTIMPANGSPRIGPWVRRSINSGYCSVVDSLSTRRQMSNVFADSNGNWNNIFLPGGALNTSLVLRPQPDQESVKTMRNGDGNFLDFGPNSLMAAINFRNTLGLKKSPVGTGEEYEAEAQSKYFNSIIGLPMKCNTNSCKNTLLASPNDNNALSTTELLANHEVVDADPVIDDFFVGNSQITNPGISTYGGAASLVEAEVTEGNSGGGGRVLTSLTVNAAGVETARESLSYPDQFVGQSVKLYRVVWDVARSTILTTLSGGGSRTSGTGRYTASLSSIGTGNNYNTGVRCAIKVNED